MRDSCDSKEEPAAVTDEMAIKSLEFEKLTNETSASKESVNEETDSRAQIDKTVEEEKSVNASSEECLSQYLATQVMQTPIDRIQCPTCEQRLDAAVMKDFADTTTFDK
ncbi:MAG: hypothetical protein Q9191_005548 [Dirinaria sp. TL-2023a]